MAKGKVGVFAQDTVEGVVDLNIYDGPTELSAKRPEVVVPFTSYGGLARSFVIVDVETSRTYTPLWRLVLNDFSLTKIFRPNVEVEHEGVRHSSIVYDVTPLVKEGRNELEVIHKGETPLTLNAVAVVNVYNVERFSTKYSISAGELLIGPGESYEEICEGECKALIKTPLDSRVRVITGAEERFDMPGYVYEVDFTKTLRIVNESPKGFVKLFALFKLDVKTPRISVDVVKDGTKVKVRNESEVNADKLIVNVLRNGVSQVFRTFEGVGPGKEVDVSADFSEQGNYSVRVVFSVSGFRRTFDFKL